ncbi:MAG TPA: hypothetical protein VGR42_05925 [Casimicrobiaceae bacterium]|nr:hypothetical protein [Casimicrobiaceae bacterium]
MTAHWSELTKILLPGLLLMSISTVPLALGTIAAALHLRKGKTGPYLRNLSGSTAVGLVALGLLFGSLFGSDPPSSSTAGLIFLFAPLYSAVALGFGYGMAALAHRMAAKSAEAIGTKVLITTRSRRFVWVPVAMLCILMFGIIKDSVQHSDLAIAEHASNPETLQWVFEAVAKGKPTPSASRYSSLRTQIRLPKFSIS